VSGNRRRNSIARSAFLRSLPASRIPRVIRFIPKSFCLGKIKQPGRTRGIRENQSICTLAGYRCSERVVARLRLLGENGITILGGVSMAGIQGQAAPVFEAMQEVGGAAAPEEKAQLPPARGAIEEMDQETSWPVKPP
jgi:hypothetical protein